jgi:hypothetical protein
MAKNEIKISVQKEMESLGDSIRKVTAAIFADQPGVAPTISGKRKTAQVTFKIHSAKNKADIQSQGRRAFTAFMRQNGAQVEVVMKKAMEAVIAGLIGGGNSNVTVFGRSLGNAKPRRRIEDEPFAKFIMSKEGAGEIGLPDPGESIRDLKAALMNALTVDARSREGFGPQLKFSFDQKRLLTHTPHPTQKDGGKPSSAFFSWLSLVTGPDFARGGTSGYGLVRIRDLRKSAGKSASRGKGGVKGMRRAQITENLIRSSRTHGNAGELAAIMMSTRKSGRGKSPAEAFGGVTEDYQPSPRFNGFWDLWWAQIKIELNMWSKRVLSATMRGILKKKG